MPGDAASLVTMMPSGVGSSYQMPGAPDPRASPAQVCAEAVHAFAGLQDAVLRGQQTVDHAIDAWTTYVRAVGTVPVHTENDSVTAVLSTLFGSLQLLGGAAGALGGGGLSPQHGSGHHLDEHLDTTPSPPARGRLRARTGNSSPHGPLSTSGSTSTPALMPQASAAAPQPRTPGAMDDSVEQHPPSAARGGSFRRQASPAVPQLPPGGLLAGDGLAPPDSDLQGGLSADECEGFKLE